MRQIRSGVFETNSSSVHSLCIQKAPVEFKNGVCYFEPGEFGWENDAVNPGDYLWTAIWYFNDGDTDEINRWMQKIAGLGARRGRECRFKMPVSDEYGPEYYIDHAYELMDFLERADRDEDFLERFIFGKDSVVYTGNDNSGDQQALCYAADETIWDDCCNEVPNPNHDPDRYEYWMKGN